MVQRRPQAAYSVTVILQNFDLLAATGSKQRTIEKCHLTYGSEISILISVRSTGRRFNQVFPPLALNPGGRRRLGRHGLASFDTESPAEFLGRKVFRLAAFMFAFSGILAH